MAEKVLFNVAGGILGNLAGPLIAEEFRMVRGVKREIEKLQNTVSAIQAVLLHAEELRATNPLVDHWLGRLDDVIYDADDVLDAVSTEVLRRKEKAGKVRIFFSKSNQLAFRLRMGHKIKGIREKLDAIAADLRDFNFVPRLVETPIRVTRRDDTYSFVLEQYVIGRKNDKEAVINSLLDTNNEESLSILPIVGIGGLGKTTLAQLVYNDERFQNFDIKMWVCVSDNFNVKNIVEKILKSAKLEPKGDEMEQLVDCLRKKIVIKKFFLVLDDVWNEDAEKWFELKMLLISDVIGNKILVTTRSNEVARITRTVEPYMLKGLREEESWDLFKKMAFDGKEPENFSVREIGKEIVRKCGGVPLALGAMGRMLYGKDSIKEWLAFRDNQLSKISKTTIISTLKLSYDILPSYLKHCFVYCSLFPKDYKFSKSLLIRLWTAQGFVKPEQNRCLEDIGHDYFMELVSRLFFQKEVVSPCSLEDNFEEDSNVFKVHDLMHDLAITMAGSLIVNQFDNKGKDAIHKARHISLCDPKNISSLYKVSKTRTLIYFGGYVYDRSEHIEKAISSLKFVRVLDLGNCKRCFRLNNINKLIHLRYLDLSSIWFSKLPNCITRLINLETLILYKCTALKKLPKNISKLVNLRHLDNSGCNECRLPREIVRLTNLQTLRSLAVTCDSSSKHNAGFEELIQLKNLRGKLQFFDWRNGIRGVAWDSRAVVDPNVESVFNVLKIEGLENQGNQKFLGVLEDLDIYSPSMKRCFQMYSKEHISRSQLTRPLNFLLTLTGLVELTVNNLLKCKHLPPLCQLPSLKEVHLSHLLYLEYILGCGDKNQLSSSTVSKTFFPSLKFLEMDRCVILNGWLWSNSTTNAKADNGGDNSPPMFPCLSKLSITMSPSLVSMPLFPDSLEDLSLRTVSWKPSLGSSSGNRSKAITSYPLAASLLTLSKLKKLELTRVSGINTLPMDGLQHLTSLENLKINSLLELKSLCLRSLHLTALKSLILYDCPQLEFANSEDGMQWQGLENLLTIKFKRLPKLVSLPCCLQHATALVEFCIKDCENLTIIQHWIHNYKSLKKLKIVNCSCLRYFPEGMEMLPSLDRILIWSCPGMHNIIRPPGYYPWWQG